MKEKRVCKMFGWKISYWRWNLLGLLYFQLELSVFFINNRAVYVNRYTRTLMCMWTSYYGWAKMLYCPYCTLSKVWLAFFMLTGKISTRRFVETLGLFVDSIHITLFARLV